MKRVFILLLLLTACFQMPTRSSKVQLVRQIEVSVQAPLKRELQTRIPFQGILTLGQQLSVFPLIEGVVAKCLVKAGETVKKGQTLCELKTNMVNLEIKRAEDALNAAEKMSKKGYLDKQQALFDSGVIGQSELEQVRLQQQQAEASKVDAENLLSIAKSKKDLHFIKATQNAVVAAVLAKPHAPVTPAMPIVVLETGGVWKVQGQLHARHYPQVSTGQQAEINFLAGRKTSPALKFRLLEKSASIEPEKQVFSITLEAKDSETTLELASGMAVSGHLFQELDSNLLSIPQQALISWDSSGLAQVYVMTKESKAEIRDIQTGNMNSTYIQVEEGLEDSDRVITRIPQGLVPGEKVIAKPVSVGPQHPL